MDKYELKIIDHKLVIDFKKTTDDYMDTMDCHLNMIYTISVHSTKKKTEQNNP